MKSIVATNMLRWRQPRKKSIHVKYFSQSLLCVHCEGNWPPNNSIWTIFISEYSDISLMIPAYFHSVSFFFFCLSVETLSINWNHHCKLCKNETKHSFVANKKESTQYCTHTHSLTNKLMKISNGKDHALGCVSVNIKFEKIYILKQK